MKSLEIILIEHGFDTSFYKEDIRDNEYILISSLQNKRESAVKNLHKLFLGKHEGKLQSIFDSVDEFLNNLKEK